MIRIVEPGCSLPDRYLGASNDLLVLIDGVSRTMADLRGVNPRDVERIEVVKDAGASFYGARVPNGVIVITTKRAR